MLQGYTLPSIAKTERVGAGGGRSTVPPKKGTQSIRTQTGHAYNVVVVVAVSVIVLVLLLSHWMLISMLLLLLLLLLLLHAKLWPRNLEKHVSSVNWNCRVRNFNYIPLETSSASNEQWHWGTQVWANNNWLEDEWHSMPFTHSFIHSVIHSFLPLQVRNVQLVFIPENGQIFDIRVKRWIFAENDRNTTIPLLALH